MSAVLTREFRTDNLVNFLNGYFGNNPISTMYLCFGEPNEWPMDENGKTEGSVGFIIPVPDGRIVSSQFRETVLAGIKVLASDVAPIIPRINWQAGTSYYINDVVITDEWNVYLCVNNVSNSTKPTSTSYLDPNTSWQFMYKISEPTMFSKFVTNEWIPVHTNTMSTIATGSSESIVPDPLAIYKVSTITFMIDKVISGDTFTQEELNDCRRLGIWSNVQDKTTNNVLSNTTFLTADIDTSSGSIIYVDNRPPIYRYTNQTEEHKVLIGF